VIRTMGVVALLLFALATLGCSAAAPSSEVRVRVENATDIPVAVYVEDDWRGTDEPGSTLVVPLGAGSPPLTIEARSPSGATLATLEVDAARLEALRQGDPDNVLTEEFGVPCGVIRIVVGEHPAGWAPAPAEAVAGEPCP
jgi:predicted RNA methylase